MNHSEPPHPPSGARRVLHGSILLFLATLAIHRAHAIPRAILSITLERPGLRSPPYLRTIGPAPLRFEEQPSMPDPVSPPSAPMVATPPADAATEIAAIEPPAAVTTTSIQEVATTPEPAPNENESPAAKAPLPILRDDARPAVRPEDLIPYFQLPGSSHKPGGLNVIVPVPPSDQAPASVPPSSATYTQTPR
jgi:hypothetical protein